MIAAATIPPGQRSMAARRVGDAGETEIATVLRDEHDIVRPSAIEVVDLLRDVIDAGWTEQAWQRFHEVGNELAGAFISRIEKETMGHLPLLEEILDDETDSTSSIDYAGGRGELKMESRIRKLRPDDFEAVVALDEAIVGRSRRGYFEKRLAAALRDPSAHIQFTHEGDGGLSGIVFARVLKGEYGRDEATVALEVIDVDPTRTGQGIGDRLLTALEDEARRRGITEIQTEAAWSDHVLLGFLGASGFELAPRQVLRRTVADADRF